MSVSTQEDKLIWTLVRSYSSLDLVCLFSGRITKSQVDGLLTKLWFFCSPLVDIMCCVWIQLPPSRGDHMVSVLFGFKLRPQRETRRQREDTKAEDARKLLNWSVFLFKAASGGRAVSSS